jgi:hypothetical protein
LTPLLHGHSGLAAVFDTAAVDNWLIAVEADMGIDMSDRADPRARAQIRALLRGSLAAEVGRL